MDINLATVGFSPGFTTILLVIRIASNSKFTYFGVAKECRRAYPSVWCCFMLTGFCDSPEGMRRGAMAETAPNDNGELFFHPEKIWGSQEGFPSPTLARATALMRLRGSEVLQVTVASANARLGALISRAIFCNGQACVD